MKSITDCTNKKYVSVTFSEFLHFFVVCLLGPDDFLTRFLIFLFGFSLSLTWQQALTMRLQKERDVVGQEAESLREKLELVQSQVAKATRDRELLLSETESSRERFDKVNQNLLKVQVRISDLYLLFPPTFVS